MVWCGGSKGGWRFACAYALAHERERGRGRGLGSGSDGRFPWWLSFSMRQPMRLGVKDVNANSNEHGLEREREQ